MCGSEALASLFSTLGIFCGLSLPSIHIGVPIFWEGYSILGVSKANLKGKPPFCRGPRRKDTHMEYGASQKFTN